MDNVIYARLVDKEEVKRIRKLRTIGIPSSTELVPAFEATNVLDCLIELKPDDIKTLHILLGGNGSARFIILFIPDNEPVVKGINLRNKERIKKLLGYSINESKFSSNTAIEIEQII